MTWQMVVTGSAGWPGGARSHKAGQLAFGTKTEKAALPHTGFGINSFHRNRRTSRPSSQECRHRRRFVHIRCGDGE